MKNLILHARDLRKLSTALRGISSILDTAASAKQRRTMKRRKATRNRNHAR